MPSSLFFKSVVLATLLVLGGQAGHAQHHGLQIRKYGVNASDLDPQGNDVGPLEVTVVAVYPTARPEIEKANLLPLAPLFGAHEDHVLVADSITRYYMSLIESAYFTVARAEGLFNGSPDFERDLRTKEPFYDGRSAALAVFSGNDLSKPISTLRIAYPTDSIQKLPLENRTGVDLSKLRVETEAEVLAPQLFPTLGLDARQGLAIKVFAETFKQSSSFGSQLMGSLVENLAPQTDRGHDIVLASGHRVPHDRLLQALSENLNHPVIYGGRAAELKSLSNSKLESGADLLHFTMRTAVELGYFDLVPFRIGAAIPRDLVAEVSLEALDKYYKKNWPWKKLTTMMDLALGKQIAFVEMSRPELANVIGGYYLRNSILPKVWGAKGDPRWVLNSYDELAARVQAEKLTFQGLSSVAPTNAVQSIHMDLCARALSAVGIQMSGY